MKISDFEGNCFVYVQGNEANIEKYYELVNLSKDDLIILYPERHMTFVDQVCYIPYVKSIVTENPWLISLYDRRKVWVIKNNEWTNPDIQTFGASIDIITSDILNYERSVPLAPLFGIDEIEKYKTKVKNNDF